MSRFPIAIALFTLLSGAAQAASFCVSNSAEFQAAYDAASVNGESSNTIRLRSGTYLTPDKGLGSKFSPVYPFQSPGTLTIEGGWTAFMATPCALQSLNPAVTVIDGGGVNKGLYIYVSNSPTLAVTVRNLTFQGGRSPTQATDDRGAGLEIAGPAGYSGSILVERCIFRDNEAVFIGDLYTSGEGTTVVRNNLFVGNAAQQGAALYALGAAGGAVAFNNNTIVENTATGSGVAAAAILFGGAAPRVMSNNIVWHNTVGTQSDLYGPDVILIDNLVEKVKDTPQNGSDGNLALDPKFVDVMDFRLDTATSPAINRGNDGPYGGVTTKDLTGGARITGTGIDLGAYESAVLLRDSFE